jgi:lipopolysaccharide export LptBFGC system permease protein LptF
MTNPIETKDGKTTIDNVAIDSIAQRILNGIKLFLINVFTQKQWDRLGLEKTWKYFLPLTCVVALCIVHYAAPYLAYIVLLITGYWLVRSIKR